ncbi:linoleate diol synthase [Peniophora sp. CONT]|nr:linoleate diol synthase [Peniophora sp. CONT]
MSSNRTSRILPRGLSTNNAKPAPVDPEQDEHGVPKIINELRDQIKRGVQGYIVDPRVLGPAIDFLKNPNEMDDRKMLLEFVLTALATHRPSTMKTFFEGETVKLLYNDLAHPPATQLGDPYNTRQPDGSYNNIDVPNMGKSFTPYARSVQQTHPLPPNELPDPGLIFDTLLKREKFVKHPAGLNSLMFSFAALVIHTVFRTSHTDPNRNETSSYVDLSPLYGHTGDELDKLRVFDGRGMLKPDTFAEDRLLLLPPAVCTLLVLFNRNHNYIAKKLLEINERGTWKDPMEYDTSDDDQKQALLKQDKDILQIARLVNCGWFGSAVFSDYFASILGLVRLGSSWSLNPFGEMRGMDHELFERGRGNVCSVEFNCLYRWHATTSVEDEQWIGRQMSELFKKPADDISPQEFLDKVAEMKKSGDTEPSHWTFGHLLRQENGSFKDSDLALWIKNATEHPASAFKARGTPEVMRLHEIMGIQSNRRWGVCSLNDFRKFLGLKPYASFLEWNPDPKIATAAENLYGDIDHLELYVGLQAEEAKRLVPGAGLCPGYTISRAILSDAIALTRGDRFFTADYTPHNMTAWGFADCHRDENGPGNGSMLGRLFMRTLPNEFTENSTYAWFPLQTPESMMDFLRKLDVADQYDYARPPEPQPTVIITDYRDAEVVLKSPQFVASYGMKAARIVKGKGFFIANNDAERADVDQREVLRALIPTTTDSDTIGKFFYDKTRSLLSGRAFVLADEKILNIDILAVLKAVPLHWVMSEVLGLPLKGKDVHGVYTEVELYEKLSEIYQYLFLDIDPDKAMRTQQSAKKNVDELKSLIHSTITTRGTNRMSVSGLVNSLQSMLIGGKKKSMNAVAARLLTLGSSTDDVTNNILALMVGATVELSQCLVNAVNMVFGKKRQVAVEQIKDVPEETLNKFIYEALRIDPPFRGVYRRAVSDQTIGDQTIRANQRVFVDLHAASFDEDVFADPQAFSLNRGQVGRYLLGDGCVRVLGSELTTKIMTSVIRAIVELPGVRPGNNNLGYLKRYAVQEENAMNLLYQYIGKDQLPTPWASSRMILQYDAAGATNGHA